MRQFILPEDWDGGEACLIEGGRAQYISRVLRLGIGDTFPGRDSKGRLWTCSVLESSPGRLLLSIAPRIEEIPLGGLSLGGLSPRILLVQGIPKGVKMDLVVRQATEAGVSAVLPLLSERALPRGFGYDSSQGASRSEESFGNRLSRWERIVREALQQSGSTIHTEIMPPISLTELPVALAARGVAATHPKILLHEAPLAHSSMHEYLTGAPEMVVLCVGPEGGFSPEEVDFLLSEGFMPLRFAGAILRAETAALYAIAAAQIVVTERSSWIPKSR
jgi:16S rRNA (uracil1498-N3)-methyltransferase